MTSEPYTTTSGRTAVAGRRLTRSRTDRMAGGVCGGLGEYFDVDPVIVRLAMAVFALAGGGGVLVYLVAWLIVPEADANAAGVPAPYAPPQPYAASSAPAAPTTPTATAPTTPTAPTAPTAPTTPTATAPTTPMTPTASAPSTTSTAAHDAADTTSTSEHDAA